MGCGRGAVTLPAAAAAGDTGSVTAVDVSPAMAAHTRAAAERGGFDNVHVAVLDATRPGLPERSFDVLAASLVLFFSPDPATTLAAWVRLVQAGGRVGVTTFGEQDEAWREVDGLFCPYLPPGFLDPRVSTDDDPFATDATMELLIGGRGRRGGAHRARAVHRPLRGRRAVATVDDGHRSARLLGLRARARPGDAVRASGGRARADA